MVRKSFSYLLFSSPLRLLTNQLYIGSWVETKNKRRRRDSYNGMVLHRSRSVSTGWATQIYILSTLCCTQFSLSTSWPEHTTDLSIIGLTQYDIVNINTLLSFISRAQEVTLQCSAQCGKEKDSTCSTECREGLVDHTMTHQGQGLALTPENARSCTHPNVPNVLARGPYKSLSEFEIKGLL